MKNENYKKIGDYIRVVDERNKDLKVETLLGLKITKQFIPSVANTIGTNMRKYKIIRKNQFACILMQVRRDKKVPVALQTEYDEALVSQAYIVFEVKNPKELLPEYLMMWMSRAEFDREACFYAVGGVRGTLEWEDFCNMELPVPTLEKQQEIVDEYNTIINRIKLNEQLNQKLEETAQTIYKEWFVNFEFPMTQEYAASIGKPELAGKPYKSNGGEMVWNEELGQEVPKGWEVKDLNTFCTIGSSKRIFYSEYKTKGVPFYRGKEITAKKEGRIINDLLFISRNRFNEIKKKNDVPFNGDILLTAVGTIGKSYLVRNEEFYFKDGNIIWFKFFIKKYTNFYIYDYMQSKEFNEMIQEITIGSTQNAITIANIGQRPIIQPNSEILETYGKLSQKNHNQIGIVQDENIALHNFKNLILSKMTKV